MKNLTIHTLIKKMIRVLQINHSDEQCGVYQFGKRFGNLASRSKIIDYIYAEVDNADQFIKVRDELNPDYIIYNWYPVTMSWLTDEMITSQPSIGHWFIFHDGFVRSIYDGYLFSGQGEKDAHALRIEPFRSYILPRPLFDYEGTYQENDIPTIGSFGFGGWQKGFPDLVTLVGETFTEAVLNINMTFAYFGDREGTETRKIAAMCRELNIYDGLELNISHEFRSDKETLDFLAGNDLNVFLYYASNEGLSSVTDYALSVNRPIAITNDMMFRHIVNDEIIIENNSLIDIMEKGIEPIRHLKEAWSTENFVKEFDSLFIERYNAS